MSFKKSKLDVQSKQISIHESYRNKVSNAEIRKLDDGFITNALGDKINLFNKYRAIIISTPPGTGKTTFSENTMVDFAQLSHKGKVVIVMNRIALDISTKKRIAKKLEIYEGYNDAALHQMTDFGNIIFLTYQQLKIKVRNGTLDDKGIAFIIFDEAHYFTSDATFSKDNGWLLRQIPKTFSNAVRIYITATVKQVLPYIFLSECNSFATSRWNKRWLQDCYYNKIYKGIANISEHERYELLLDEQFASTKPTPILYEQTPDFSHIKLNFYADDEYIERLLMENDDKAIIFVNTKERGQELQQKLSDAEYMDAETKIVNPEFIGNLVEKEAFDKKFLITTSVFENGCNIKDDKVKTVVIENIDPVSIVQMAGRRRKCCVGDTFSLYLKIPTLKYLRQLRFLTREKLRLIFNAEECPNRFMQELLNPTTSKMLENIISVDAKKYTFDWLTKCVLQDNTDYYDELIDCISKSGIRGYCSKIANECFGQEFCDKMLKQSSESNFFELSGWLENYSFKVLSEEEFKEFVSEFKRKYTPIVGVTNSENRGKQRQDVGYTWFNNRMKKHSLPFELISLSGERYFLIKRECENEEN